MPVAFLWRPDASQDHLSLAVGALAILAGTVAVHPLLLSAGLALTIAGLIPFSSAKFWWIGTSISWMPFSVSVLPGFSLGEAAVWSRAGLAILGLVGFAWVLAFHADAGAAQEELRDIPELKNHHFGLEQ
jgi:hypothetical protein